MIAPSKRRKDHRRPLSESEIRDIRAREDREGTPYSDRDMLLDHIEFMYQHLEAISEGCERRRL